MSARLVSCPRLVAVILAAGLVALLLLKGGGPEPELWHSVHLDAEFTAHRADEVDDFTDYLRLEDALFQQLQDAVYAHTATGPAYALARYSPGSAADPQQQQHNWNRSFELTPATAVGGVLLLHGMSDAPYSLRALGETLHARGYRVLGLRLPGHGTAPSGLTHVSWQDMAAAVRLAMQHLAKALGDRPIHVIGYSTGAPLALDFALHAAAGDASPMPASLILVSPAIGVSPAAALAVWKRRLSVMPGLGGLAWLQVQPEFDPFKYNSFATNAAEQVHRLTRSVGVRIAALRDSGRSHVLPPVLVFKSSVDATVSTDAVVDSLLTPLHAADNELVLFDINRAAVKSTLLVADPGPLTARVMEDDTLPFRVTLVTNAGPDSSRVIARHKSPGSNQLAEQPLAFAWPRGTISLSHVALPIPPDDPLYGRRPPGNEDALFLGEMAIQGERGLMTISSDWLLRLRYNPFYDYLEQRTLAWLGGGRRQAVTD